MANDEKMAARDEDTFPADSDMPSLDDSLAGPLGKAAAKDDDKARFGKTLPFPGTKGQQASVRLEDSFGMPDFGFFADPSPASEPPVRESMSFPDLTPSSKFSDMAPPAKFPDLTPPAKADEPPAVTATAEPEALSEKVIPQQQANGAIPLQEGTGWDSVDSIAKPSSLRERIEMQDAGEATIGELFASEEEPAEDLDDAEKSAGLRHEANITPFPGTVLHLHSERAPSDMLRGGGKSADIFDDLALRAGEEDAAPADPEANPDALADAVQSALRNIYGSYSEPQPEAGELGGYTVADALAGPEPAMEEPVWAEERTAPVEWAQGPRARDYEADQPSAEAAAGEPALDYFFNQRRQERAAPQLSPEMSLNEYAARSALEEKWEPEPEAESEDDRRVMPFPGRDRADSYRGREPAVGEASIIRTGGFFSDDSRRPVEPEWGQPAYGAPQNARGTITPTYAPTVTASGDQMPGQAPDSGHLLGAAGLGLIGGIALAGVLAVFVFNSFVDDTGQPVASSAGKIDERFVNANATTDPLQVRVPEPRPAAEPVRQPPQPVEVVRQPPQPVEAARQPASPVEPLRHPAPVAEPPAATAQAPAPSEPRRAPALNSGQTAMIAPPLPTPDSGGGARLVASSVSGQADTAIRLNIVIADGDAGDALVSLKGLPRGAKLSTPGIDVGGGQVLLPPNGLKDLTITLPAGSEGTYRLEAQLLKDSAQTSVSEPVPFTLTIGAVTPGRTGQLAPNAAPRPGGATQAAVLPDEAPLPETDFLTTVLIKDGNKLMREGDIAAAQRTYEKAAASGNPEAFLALGRSYDPTYFEKLNVKTGRPDPAKAFDSYKKALDGGVLGARDKIDKLKQWLQR